MTTAISQARAFYGNMKNLPLMCKNPECEEIVEPERAALGYKTCIYCGSPRKQFTIAIAANKGTYEVIPESQIKLIGRK